MKHVETYQAPSMEVFILCDVPLCTSFDLDDVSGSGRTGEDDIFDSDSD